MRGQGTNCMLDISSAVETNKQNAFDKKTGRKGAGTPILRAWDSGPVSSEGGREISAQAPEGALEGSWHCLTFRELQVWKAGGVEPSSTWLSPQLP